MLPPAAPSPTRTYTDGYITVIWRAELCSHCENCWRGLPEVFNPLRRPWVDMKGASTEAIKRQVAECPSGALSVEPVSSTIVEPA